MQGRRCRSQPPLGTNTRLEDKTMRVQWHIHKKWLTKIQWMKSSKMRLSRIHAVLTATCHTRVVTNGKRLTPENYSEPLKSTNLTELCQISLGRRWIRKSNKLTKSKVNPNGTPMYDKLCFVKFCCVKDEETPCGSNSQNIFKVVLNTTKNTHVILGRQWFTTCRLQVITRKAAFTCWIL